MASKSDFLENAILNHMVGGPDYARPATLYFALYTSAPTDAGGGTEVAGGSYARAAVTNNANNFPAAVSGLKSNAVAIPYAAASAAWGNATHFGIFDAPVGGNLLFHNSLTVPRSIGSGDQYTFSINAIQFTES